MNDTPKTINVYAVIGYESPGGKYCVAFRTEVFQPGAERRQKSSLGLYPIFMCILCIRRRGQKLRVVFLRSLDSVLQGDCDRSAGLVGAGRMHQLDGGLLRHGRRGLSLGMADDCRHADQKQQANRPQSVPTNSARTQLQTGR